MAIYVTRDYQKAAAAIAQMGREFYARGWAVATSGNYSLRLNSDCCAITVSGKDKGRLEPQDVMVVNFKGEPITPQKPSAETLLHTNLYLTNPNIGAVLHTHSFAATVLGRKLAGQNVLVLEDYELLKAISGISTHETQIKIPIFENMQDMMALSLQAQQYLLENPETYGYLIRGHGLYTWGRDLAEAKRHLEALEFLLSCELEMLK